MNTTLLLLAGLAVLILVALAADYLRKRWAEAREALEYRTINASTMESHVRAIRAQVPDASLLDGPLATKDSRIGANWFFTSGDPKPFANSQGRRYRVHSPADSRDGG